MAIAINGSGTITGISAGGLPDNTVDNGTMADDAIGVAELSATGTASSSTYLRGDNSWATVSSGGISDVVSDTSPQLGGDLDTNSFEILLDDDHKIKFGDSQDLEIYYESAYGGNARITNSTGDLIIEDTAGDIYIRPKTGENAIVCHNDGATELYCDNHLKFYTDNSASGTIVYDDQHSSTTSLVFRLRKNASGTATDVRQHMMSFSVPGNNRGLAQSGSSATEAPIWAGYSDYRVKTNFRPYTGGWDAIKAIPVQLYDEDQPNYEPFDPASNQTNKKGWKAHEVQAVMPEAVTGDKDAVVTQALIDAGEYKQSELGNIIPQYLGTTAMIPTIIGALQQAMTKIETLEAKVAALEAA